MWGECSFYYAGMMIYKLAIASQARDLGDILNSPLKTPSQSVFKGNQTKQL